MKTLYSLLIPALILTSAVITYKVHAKPVYENPTSDSSSESEEIAGQNVTNSTRKEL